MQYRWKHRWFIAAIVIGVTLVCVPSAFAAPQEQDLLVHVDTTVFPTTDDVRFAMESMSTHSSILALANLGDGSPQATVCIPGLRHDWYSARVAIDGGGQIEQFSSIFGILHTEIDAPVRAFFVPSDPGFPSQWHLTKVNAESAWDLDITPPLYGGDPSVIVAVIDTGIAFEDRIDGTTVYKKAPDFSSAVFVSGYDFVHGDTHPNDDNGHGTHVAATIGEDTDNGVSGAGVAFRSSLMPIKVLDSTGSGKTSDVVNGIDFAVANGADVLNISLGASTDSQALHDAVQRALDAGVVVVAAVGNDSLNSVAFPAAYSGVIAVGAVGSTDVLASYSNSGNGITLVAPGGDGSSYVWQESFSNRDANNLPIDYINFGLVGIQGTSQAAPHVTGAAALLLARGVQGSSVRPVLQNTAVDLGTSGYDLQYGYGRLDIQAALLSVINDQAAPTTTAVVSPGDPDGAAGYYKTKPTVTLSSTDNDGSGLSAIRYAWDGNPVARYTTPLTASDGQHSLTFFSTDNAGNSETSRSIALSVDSIGPTISITAPIGTATTSAVLFQGRVSDATSGAGGITINGEVSTLNPDGSFSTTLDLPRGTSSVTVIATDVAGNTTTLVRKVAVAQQKKILVGAGATGGPQVLLFSGRGASLANFFAFDKKFRGGVSVASGDVNNDGSDEIITGAGPGGGPQVRIYNTKGTLLGQFFAFPKTMIGGVSVATGDLRGNAGRLILAASGPGSEPLVRIFDDKGKRVGGFSPYPKSFRGGVHVATGDIDGDGTDEIITGPGQGGGPQVRIFRFNGKLVGQFSAYASNFRGGVEVAAGDTDNNGIDEIITGPGQGGGPQVRIFNQKGKVVRQFLAYEKKFRGGIRVSAGDTNGDGNDEVITGAGPGGSPEVKVFSAAGILQAKFFSFPKSFHGGLFLASAVMESSL